MSSSPTLALARVLSGHQRASTIIMTPLCMVIQLMYVSMVGAVSSLLYIRIGSTGRLTTLLPTRRRKKSNTLM